MPIRVVAAIIERRGRILICQRPKDDFFGLQWEFPGGKIRRSETPRAALRRELWEELAVRARIGREVYSSRHRYKSLAALLRLSFFRVTAFSGVPRNLAFERMVWARRSELWRYDFLPADRLLVSRLMRGDFPPPDIPLGRRF